MSNSHYLITGAPGTGKTRIGEELCVRGYRIIRGDEDLIIKGRADWCWDEKKLARMLAGNHGVFVCGGADNDHLFLKRFKRIFILTCDESTRLDRLRKQGIAGRESRPKQYDGAVFINCGQEVRAVIFEILRRL